MSTKQLKITNNKASITTLLDIYDHTIERNKKANAIKDECTDTMETLVDSVKKRLASDDNIEARQLCNKQTEKIVKLWQIAAASMVKVKRSIRLPRFFIKGEPVHGTYCYDKSLCVSPIYGIKEWRKCSSYNPFGLSYGATYISNIDSTDDQFLLFTYKDDRLNANFKSNMALDFTVLQSIPQLDQEKVVLFVKITKDIVHMINSWRNYYVTHNKNSTMLDKLTDTSGYTIFTNETDRTSYRESLKNLDKIIAYKKKLSDDSIKQFAKWQPTIDYWKEINKNFLVLAELKKTKLKV